MLATSPPEDYHCGTRATGYLNTTTLPSTPGLEVDAIVCFHGSRSKCDEKAKIKIKKCRDFFIYYLPNTGICHYGYCGQE